MNQSLFTAFLISAMTCGLTFVNPYHSVSYLPSTVLASDIVSMVPYMAWNQTYVENNFQSAQSIIQTVDGGFLLGGLALPNNRTPFSIELLKADSSGNPQWNKTYMGSGVALGKWLVQTTDGGFAFAGQLGNECWLVKVDDEGNIQWNQTYSGSTLNSTSALIKTIDGGYALTGYTDNYTNRTHTFSAWLMKTDATGNEQ